MAVNELVMTGTGTAAFTVRVNEEVPVPPALEAERVTLFVPGTVGIPEINPVLGLFDKPAGRLLAPYEVGLLEAVIW